MDSPPAIPTHLQLVYYGVRGDAAPIRAALNALQKEKGTTWTETDDAFSDEAFERSRAQQSVHLAPLLVHADGQVTGCSAILRYLGSLLDPTGSRDNDAMWVDACYRLVEEARVLTKKPQRKTWCTKELPKRLVELESLLPHAGPIARCAAGAVRTSLGAALEKDSMDSYFADLPNLAALQQ